jgi:hypothetical protein
MPSPIKDKHDNYLHTNKSEIQPGFNEKTFADFATVLDNYQLCFFPEEQWNELLQLYADVARKFLRILSAELRYKDEHPP